MEKKNRAARGRVPGGGAFGSRPENEAPTPAEKNRAPRRETSGDLVPQSTAQVPPKTKSSDTASSTNLPHSTVNTTRGAVARRPNPEAVRSCLENRAGHIATLRSAGPNMQQDNHSMDMLALHDTRQAQSSKDGLQWCSGPHCTAAARARAALGCGFAH